jgi:hypothetical protein
MAGAASKLTLAPMIKERLERFISISVSQLGADTIDHKAPDTLP